MPGRPRLLILDNSPRHLGAGWFGKWFRALGCDVHTYHAWSGSLPASLDRFDGLVISGSPASAVRDDEWIVNEMRLVEQAEKQRLPVLGACFGSQLIARTYYGAQAVRRSAEAEFGWKAVELCGHDALLAGAPRAFTAFQFHLEEVVPQPGMRILADSRSSPVQAFRVGRRPVWGLQFHLEVTPRSGRDFLRKTEPIYQPYGLRYAHLAAQAQPCEITAQVLGNFVNIVCG